jgi:hypothetical protein
LTQKVACWMKKLGWGLVYGGDKESLGDGATHILRIPP